MSEEVKETAEAAGAADASLSKADSVRMTCLFLEFLITYLPFINCLYSVFGFKCVFGASGLG